MESMSEGIWQGGETIYHYCSVDSFLRIVQSGEIWLTNIFFMNDSAEHYWLRHIAVAVIDRLVSESEEFDRVTGKQIRRRCLATNDFHHVYCACFSEDGDSLGQWRSYGDDGKGVAVGFNVRALDLACLEVENTTLERVEYDRGNQERRVEELLRGAVKGAPLKWFVHQLIFSELWRLAAHCKNPKFSEEKEARLIRWVTDPVDENNEPIEGVRYRAANGLLTPYCPMPYKVPEKHRDDTLGPIVEVVFGPKNERKLNEPVARMVLAETGFDVKEIKFGSSAATYRGH